MIPFADTGCVMLEGNRRSFLRGLTRFAGLAMTAPSARCVNSFPVRDDETARSQTALQMRQAAAEFQCRRPTPQQIDNGDESAVPGHAACFTKGLPHDQSGRVDPSAYASLLRALATGQHSDFESIDRGSGMKLVNPEAAFAYELAGADSHSLAAPPAPKLSSTQAAAEMVELYWQSLVRDVSFAGYSTAPLIQAAAQDLTKLSNLQSPKELNSTVSASTIFRGSFSGCLTGPFVSQFLWKPVPSLSTWLDQRYRVPVPGIDYLVEHPEWLVLQSGLPPYREYVFDSTPRYICNGRGLAEWVHYDFLYQAFHNAALILLNYGPESILYSNVYYSPSNPYKNSKVQTGFATFGPAQICGWLGRVTTAALEAVWYQKWSVHRRLRPEEFGGLIHQQMTGAGQYPISPELLNSAAVSVSRQTHGTYLLSQAYPEGCPLHPAYPAGHATVAGACSAVLKAFFDENGLVTNCVVANSDGTLLMPYEEAALTVGGEINKLAFNIAIGRNFAGIHYRSDATAGFRLGEDVAIAMLQDLVNTLTEDFPGFSFSRLDGTPVEIQKGALS